MTEGVMGGTFARKVLDQFDQTVRERGQKVGQQWGEAVDGETPSRAQTVQLWNYRNPQSVTPEGQMYVQQLVAQGQHAAALDFQFPYRGRLIGNGDINRRIERAQKLAEMAMKAEMEAMAP